MPEVTRERIIEALRTVEDPELHRDLVSLEMVKHVAVCDGAVKVHIELTTPACPLKDAIGKDVTAAIERLDGVRQVELEWSARVRQQEASGSMLPGVKNVVAVGAGKGGVGKSTAAVLLAVGLRRQGAAVGLLDADVYGPSIPKMMGIEDRQPSVRGERILPIEADGVQVMSMGFMVERERAIIWRGPMVHHAVRQFLEQVDWQDLDYLIVDLPPGTGDVPLTLAQTIPMTGSVVVCTPQDVALLDATRAVRMYEQLNVPCLGIIENMSYYICPHCGHRDEIFAHGGAQRAAGELKVPFLGAIPLHATIRRHGDSGESARTFTLPDGAVVEAVEGVVVALAGRISVKTLTAPVQPTLSVER